MDRNSGIVPNSGRASLAGSSGACLPWWCDADAIAEPRRFLSGCPKARPTPLLSFPSLARKLGLGSVRIKDETARLGLGSFKALGGAYAVMRVAERCAAARLGRPVPASELTSPRVRETLAGLTVSCASDGNHGRSVAAGARLVGMGCVVFLHAGVSEERAQDIRDLGAEVIRVAGDYDESVALAAERSDAPGWTLVADTARAADEPTAETCGFVMQGYTVMVDEMLEQSALGSPPSHLFIQAGVGGLAASVFGHWTARTAGQSRPRFVVVEPERSACLLESARAGMPVRLEGRHTVMAMLECQSPSLLAWPVVSALADLFMTVSEEEALCAVGTLASPEALDPVLQVGESGAAGVAGLLQATQSANRRWFDLDEGSHVLVIATEGRTTGRLAAGSAA